MGLGDENLDGINDEDMEEKIIETADKSLITSIKIFSELRRASDLSAYSRHPKIGPK
jgi:hypothetical protein